MKYVDDAEFWFDPAAGVIQVRSASSLGSSDLGVNRERIEFIPKSSFSLTYSSTAGYIYRQCKR
jgi:uncharacterized protein (DUF1499 family)